MQKLNWLLSLLLLLGMCFSSCEDNDPFVSGPAVEVAFAGQVINENNEPVSGALVKAGDEATLTDANGVFRLAATRLPGDHALVTVEKSGYFSFNRAYQVKNKSIQSLTIQLLEQTEVGLLNGGIGGTIQVPGGATLIFPAKSLAYTSGALYFGDVRVIARFLDPTDRQTMALSMPGNLSAINAAGELRQLATFGMIGVELYATNGQKLNVAAGQQVEVRVPIDPSIVSSAPNDMPLWHYNEADGYWMEEGLAQKSGNEYVGKVSHFSWWNYDAPYPSINASGHVYFDNLQTPAMGVHVWIGPANQGMGWGCGHGQTDMNGFYSGAIAKDMPLKIWVTQYSSACNGIATLYTADIGPFSSDVTIPDIILTNVPNLQTISVQGRLVDCNNAPVTNGYAKLQIDNDYTLTIISDNDGLFSYTYATCTTAPVGGNVIGYDLTDLKESALQNFTFSNNTANLGDIVVCTALSEFVQYSLDGGATITLVDPVVSVLQDSFPATGYATSIWAESGNQFSINLGWSSPNIQTGVFPLDRFFVSPLEVNMAQSNLNTTVTSVAFSVGDLIIGTFGGTFVDFNGGNHTITGNYRVKRDW
jgi:hypothetical protein